MDEDEPTNTVTITLGAYTECNVNLAMLAVQSFLTYSSRVATFRMKEKSVFIEFYIKKVLFLNNACVKFLAMFAFILISGITVYDPTRSENITHNAGYNLLPRMLLICISLLQQERIRTGG